MASRAAGALFGLVAAIVLVTSIVSPVLAVVPGWWDGHPTIAGHVTTAKSVHITPLGGMGCNTGGAGECQSLPLGSAFKLVGYAELAVIGLAALLAALLALSVWRIGDRRKLLGKLAILAAVVAGAGAGAMLAIGPLDPGMHVDVPIGPGLFLFAGAIALTAIGGVIAQRVQPEPLRLKSSLARIPRPTQPPPQQQPARDVRDVLRDQHDHLRPSALGPEPMMGGAAQAADAAAARGSAPLLAGAPQLRPLYEAAPGAGGNEAGAPQAFARPAVQVPMRAPTPMPRDAIAALTGVTPPPAVVPPPAPAVPAALRSKAVSAPPPARRGSEPDSQPIDPPAPIAPAIAAATGRPAPRTNPPPPLRTAPPTNPPPVRAAPPTNPPRSSPPTSPPPRSSPPTSPPPRSSPPTSPPPVRRTPDPDVAASTGKPLQAPAIGRSTPMLGSTPLKHPPGPAAARAKAASVAPPPKLPGISVPAPAPSTGPVKRGSQPTLPHAVPPPPTSDNQPPPAVLPASQSAVRAATDADDRLETALRETELITAVEIDHEAKAAALAERQAIARQRIAEEQQLAQAIDSTDTGIQTAPPRPGTESGHTPAPRLQSPRLDAPAPASPPPADAPRLPTDTGVDPRGPVTDETPAPALAPDLAEAAGGRGDLMKTIEQNPKALPHFTTPSPAASPGAATQLPISTAPASLPPPRKTEAVSTGPTPACPQCEAPMAWVEEHLRFYCKQCRMYF